MTDDHPADLPDEFEPGDHPPGPQARELAVIDSQDPVFALSTRGQLSLGAVDALAHGNLKALSNADRVAYYIHRCELAGLDAAAHPFRFIDMGGKAGVVLYATKEASSQLTAKHRLSVTVTSRGMDDEVAGLYVVQARASNGMRDVDDIGAVDLKGLSGTDLANAIMKAATKAKRRAVLSWCGLGELDATEVDSVMAQRAYMAPEQDDEIVAEAMPEPADAEWRTPTNQTNQPQEATREAH